MTRERPTARPSTMPTTVPAARPMPSTSRLWPIASSRMPSRVMLTAAPLTADG